MTYIALLLLAGVFGFITKNHLQRIKALEEDLTDLEKSFNQYLETSLTAADTMQELVRVSQEHDRELMSIRSRLPRRNHD